MVQVGCGSCSTEYRVKGEQSTDKLLYLRNNHRLQANNLQIQNTGRERFAEVFSSEVRSWIQDAMSNFGNQRYVVVRDPDSRKGGEGNLMDDKSRAHFLVGGGGGSVIRRR